MDKFRRGVELASAGRTQDAISIFEDILIDDPENSDVLYNMGLCFNDLNEPEKAIDVLKKTIRYKPEQSNAYVALGYAYSKLADNENAVKNFLKALKLEPDNPYAMRNLGGVFGNIGNTEKALYYLEKAYRINPSDANTIYGLGYCYQKLGDYQNADFYYRKIVEMDAPPTIKEQSKDGLREIAVSNLKSKGLRMDAVMYMLIALGMFDKADIEKVKEITYDIALTGRSGFDINNPDEKYTIRSLPGVYSGLQLVSYMYVGFKHIAPEQDVGVDLEAEYSIALKLFNSGDVV